MTFIIWILLYLVYVYAMSLMFKVKRQRITFIIWAILIPTMLFFVIYWGYGLLLLVLGIPVSIIGIFNKFQYEGR